MPRKKGRKRRGDDDEDWPEKAPVATTDSGGGRKKGKQKRGGGDEVPEDIKTIETPPAEAESGPKLSRKQRRKKKKDVKSFIAQERNDSDDEDPLKLAEKLGFQEEEEPEEVTPAPSFAGGFGALEESSEEEAPMSSAGGFGALDDSSEEEEPAVPEEIPVEAPPPAAEEPIPPPLPVPAVEEEATATKAPKTKKKPVKDSTFAHEDGEFEATKKAETVELINFSCSVAGGGEVTAMSEHSRDIKVEQFTINAAEKPLFEDASLQIVHGRRYGFIGPNGQGKTTLLKHIAMRELPIPSHIDVLYVEQEVEGSDEVTAVDMVLAADAKRTALMDREAAIMTILDQEPTESDDAEKFDELQQELTEIYEEMEAQGCNDAEPRTRKILAGLGFSIEMQDRSTSSFSGGWRMRISLARALFIRPTLLLLDEPTNHLDLNAVLWLDDYLQSWPHTLLIVSHDQDFLSSVCTDIMHLENRKLVYYRGDFDDFKRMHAQRSELQKKEYVKQQKHLKSLKSKGRSKKQAIEVAASSSSKKKKTILTNMDAHIDGDGLYVKPKEYVVRFTFPPANLLAPPVIAVSGVEFVYPKGPKIFNCLDLGLDLDSRVAIVGPNGSGKSTFLNLLTGALRPTSGSVRRNGALRIGRYNQHFMDILPMDISPVEFIRNKYDVQYQAARALLGRFGLEGHAHTIPIRDCSGGQKSRVVFAAMTCDKPHILILDEPTNHLDIESIDALCEAINEFDGGVILVSHDARLITSTDCLLWECRDYNVSAFGGDFDDYRERLLEEIALVEKEAEEQARVRANERAKGLSRRAAQVAAKAAMAAMAARAAHLQIDDASVALKSKESKEQEKLLVADLFADMKRGKKGEKVDKKTQKKEEREARKAAKAKKKLKEEKAAKKAAKKAKSAPTSGSGKAAPKKKKSSKKLKISL